MNLFKFILYSVIAYFVIRFVARLFAPAPQKRGGQPGPEPGKAPESLEKPRFTIEAESVDYEIIDEAKEKNEK